MKKENTKKVLNVYKPLRKSPLETIELFRQKNPEYQNIKLGYAGRLDPMAEGVLLILVGEELKSQKTYWSLDKELVKGDFRQKLIMTIWKNIFRKTKQKEFFTIKIKIFVSSGAYIRTIAHEFGKKLGTNAILLHLKRTKVGKFKEQKSLKFI